jgi:hypothetical protein
METKTARPIIIEAGYSQPLIPKTSGSVPAEIAGAIFDLSKTRRSRHRLTTSRMLRT